MVTLIQRFARWILRHELERIHVDYTRIIFYWKRQTEKYTTLYETQLKEQEKDEL